MWSSCSSVSRTLTRPLVSLVFPNIDSLSSLSPNCCSSHFSLLLLNLCCPQTLQQPRMSKISPVKAVVVCFCLSDVSFWKNLGIIELTLKKMGLISWIVWPVPKLLQISRAVFGSSVLLGLSNFYGFTAL